ncbi:hypothetical protein EYF80_048380 [Liparis tanakae]|uniref:Uncharacterized protein n=1 Tax=Liparis tanakae TaxID=230148 RepID=A0A4Z2FJR0_9TELE|nr:hypothetical protein EYF80_048380 [Liparis tanakae]
MSHISASEAFFSASSSSGSSNTCSCKGTSAASLATKTSAAASSYLGVHLHQLALQLIQLGGAEAPEEGVLIDVPGVRHGS